MTYTTDNATISVKKAKQAVDDLQKLQKKFKSADALLMRANKAVYAVLSAAFDVLVDLRTAEEHKRVIELFDKQLEEMTRSKKAKHATAATSLELKVVRFVCGDLKQKRESSYARVLRVAFEEGVHNNADMDFVDWVLGSGGIDSIRRSKNGKPRVDFAEVARGSLKITQALAPVPSAHITTAAKTEEADGDFCVAIVRKNKDGTYAIVTTVDNASLTKQALARAGKVIADQKEKRDALDEQRKHEAAASTATQELLGQSASTTEYEEAA